MPVIVSYQGEPGAFSSQAALQAFPDCELLPCATFEDALAAVGEGTARYGMIPIDNSIAGRVADIHHLLPRSGLHIVGEHFLPIRFHLMAAKGATLGTLKTVQSHIHALGQCRKIIRKLGLKAEVAADTAGSARQVAEAGDLSLAAIAPRIAAEVYGLEILMEDIEDEAHNTTRFVILSKYPEFVRQGAGKTVTTLVFRVRNIPAALYKAMGGFATNGINMTKLESYMVDGHFSATMFYADVEGHPDDPDLKRALQELDYFSREMKILGVYPAHAFRDSLAEAGE
ncbi:prephenate dehydratase [Bosea sp. PAMC 26642]|uniref:prephenate dehydratase n=1 Tax=Bosea sp. (strain PAMC 26642) TaxID=1792307 RepID=UPI0007705ECF|nr:prephenate dehydratase [Bosea sp. PAMC 26642]AMJ63283.1 prephenate dehydratase [Bosea sp. PAMC 26642]